MKVLKFGGSSVGSVESLRNVKKIVESRDGSLVVVVSALGGVTDMLIKVSRMAAASDIQYKQLYQEIRQRHTELMDGVFQNPDPQLLQEVNSLLDRLGDMLQGLYLLRTLTPQTLDQIVSFGERMSSRIVAHLISRPLRQCPYSQRGP